MPSRIFDALLALAVPPGCAACRQSVPSGRILCGACDRAMPWLRGPQCDRCALPLPCAPCPAQGARFYRAWAPLAHAGPARALVAALKFRCALGAADAMADAMASCIPLETLAHVELVPVPRHPARRRRYGFDQAEILAAALARRTGRPARRCLERGGDARPQLGMARAGRRDEGRIAISPRGRVPEASVLVDDVHTTGATLDACARALRDGGAATVAVVTYTRALSR